ncbi:manganese efflux pump MntP [Sporosarcina trichiuri]|uniref:manganese efflux pump MntP n=1 Tax=Sporosarcina trichiuri TaxID=3056445 RepID=UPI0025B43669|nr:manganese efflux pump [Sporosarcina sp. 0.2-SM1T-5]WJY26516.1 manganese efflux pump [Sporosarcina sp. 0.2-SM1T-5]
MVELIAAAVTTIDILVIYTLLHVRRRKWLIALWTGLLNVLFPLAGFLMGEWSAHLLSDWSGILSSVLLVLIGVHMLLQEEDTASQKLAGPLLLAVAVSLDGLSISMSFGLQQLNKTLFVSATGFFSLVLSWFALRTHMAMTLGMRAFLRRLAGVILIGMGILAWIS